MAYYRIFESTVAKEVGSLPQAYDAVVPTKVTDPKYISSFPFQKAPDDVLVPLPILCKRGKRTDLISTCFMGLELTLLVSQKLYDILFSFRHFGVQPLLTRLIDKSN